MVSRNHCWKLRLMLPTYEPRFRGLAQNGSPERTDFSTIRVGDGSESNGDITGGQLAGLAMESRKRTNLGSVEKSEYAGSGVGVRRRASGSCKAAKPLWSSSPAPFLARSCRFSERLGDLRVQRGLTRTYVPMRCPVRSAGTQSKRPVLQRLRRLPSFKLSVFLLSECISSAVCSGGCVCKWFPPNAGLGEVKRGYLGWGWETAQ